MSNLEWKPIETCPKGYYEHYIVGCDMASVWIVRDAYFDEGYDDIEDKGWWSYRSSVGCELLDDIYTPTHWLCKTPEEPQRIKI